MCDKEQGPARDGHNTHFVVKWDSHRQCREQALRLGIVSERPAEVDEQVAIPRSEDETCSQLKRILSQAVLAVSRSFGAPARYGVVAAEEMEKVCGIQLGGAVSDTIGIDQQGEGNAGLLAKGARIVHVPETDRCKRGSGLLELLLVLAQLRDMLAAENSTIVPQKNDDGGILFPKRAKANIVAGALRQHNIREFRTERFRHAAIVSFASRFSRPGKATGTLIRYYFPVHIFTPDEREELRQQLVSAAQNDPNLCGAAHTGSGAASRLDRWSDIDLALSLKPDASQEQVIREWTDRLYQHGAVAHVDVMRGTTLFRVFLLRNTLQVDIAFWREEDFAPIGPNFRLIFGESKLLRPSPPQSPQSLIGMAWLYALHVRSSLARGRILQAEYMLSGMRNHVLELACLRCRVIVQQGRGLDDLPEPERVNAAACVPHSLESTELKRAFQHTMRSLLKEVEFVDRDLGDRLSGPLYDIAG